jgi:DNA-binding HxlR family transcriptional regulator
MPSSSACHIDSVLDIIGEQWTLAILHVLSTGPKRTLELHGAFTGLSTKTLTDRLKKLTRNHIVSRETYPESPPRVEYSLTEKGRALLPILQAIHEVALKWNGEPRAAAGTPEAARACPACSQTRDDDGEPRALPKPRKRTDVTLL